MARKRIPFTLMSALALLVAGAFLLGWGYNVGQSLSSQINQVIAGVPVEEARLLYLFGGIAVALGIVQLLRLR